MATCPACGKENPDGFQFCGFCTEPVAGVAICSTVSWPGVGVWGAR